MKKIIKFIIKSFRKSMDNKTYSEECLIRQGIAFGGGMLLIFASFGLPLVVIDKFGAFIVDEGFTFNVIAFFIVILFHIILNMFEKASDELDDEELKKEKRKQMKKAKKAKKKAEKLKKEAEALQTVQELVVQDENERGVIYE